MTQSLLPDRTHLPTPPHPHDLRAPGLRTPWAGGEICRGHLGAPHKAGSCSGASLSLPSPCRGLSADTRGICHPTGHSLLPLPSPDASFGWKSPSPRGSICDTVVLAQPSGTTGIGPQGLPPLQGWWGAEGPARRGSHAGRSMLASPLSAQTPRCVPGW